MSVVGIVCEYNPFHTGHLLHINETRRAFGPDCSIVCVMSGDFVQRGEPALYSKFARAEAACRCGADLVVELPLPWALSSAEGFARGAVSILGSMGAEYLSFGSEAGETGPLEEIAKLLLDESITQEIKALMAKQSELSFASARQRILEMRMGDKAGLIAKPNNILGVEYIKAIRSLDLDIKPFTLRRTGSEHDGEGSSEIKSASELRKLIRQGKDVRPFIPEQAFSVFEREHKQGRAHNAELFEIAMLSRLRALGREDYNCLPDSGDGLGNRLWKAVRTEATFDAVLASAKTKRYALSRIRRMCMCAALGIDAQMSQWLPYYGRVLACSEKGFAVLRGIEAGEGFSIVTKPASANKLSATERKIFQLGADAHDLYSLAYLAKCERKGGKDWRTSPFVVKND